jgi:putative hemolysin
MRMIRRGLGIAMALAVCGATVGAAAQAAKSNGSKAPSAQAYCTSTGGVMEARAPIYGTNGPQGSWLQLAGKQGFCQYTQASDSSRIHVALNTLYTTLAALAYYSQTAPNGQGQGNPASLYCTQLGGSDLFGGINAAGGGWVKIGTTDEVLEACIFPDDSTIDSWGLFYHSDSIIRGIDLSTVLRYANPYAAKQPGK